MRALPKRPSLKVATTQRITKELNEISSTPATQQAAEAARRYNNARVSVWFEPIVAALKEVVGEGQRCMFCSGSEAAQVEHYRPLSVYPQQAFVWKNLLWICGVCNLAKGSKFNANCCPVNPIEENVWDYFLIDEYGLFSAKWDPSTNSLNQRATETISVYNLDRQATQEIRHARIGELNRFLKDGNALHVSGRLSQEELQIRMLEFHANPLQPDVADYFLNGPGSLKPLYSSYFSVAGL